MSECRKNGYVYTGVIATQDEIDVVKNAAGRYQCIGDVGTAPMNPAKISHGFAIEHGLPEIPGYYGIDLRTGEFLRRPFEDRDSGKE